MVQPVAIALFILLVPSGVMADRPKVKPHHKVPTDWRKFVAAKVTGIPYTRPATGATTVIAYVNYGSYSGSSSTTTLAGSISLGASMSSASFYGNAATYAVADFVKTGAGSAVLSASNTYAGGQTATAGGSLNSAILGTNTTVSAGNLTTNGSASFSAGTLNLANHALSGDLVKSGVGTLTLGSAAIYTGSTIVNAGTLALTSPVLPDAGTLSLATGVLLNLNFLGSDTINQLRINGIAQSPGTWGSLTSEATYKTALITGDGILNVLSLDGTIGTTLTTGTGTVIGGTTTGGTTTVGSLAGIDPLVTNGGLVLSSGTTTLLASAVSAGPAPVPEPSSALLALLGAATLSQRRRRS